MMGKYRFLYIFVAIVICVSINIVFSGEVKADDDDTVVQSEGGTTDTDPAATSEKSEGSGPKTRPPGWDKGKKKGFDDDTPKPKPSPSE
jgi:hypothetical protein